MRTLLLARHAHARANEIGTAEGAPPGGGLTERGEAEARALGAALALDGVACVVTSRFLRAQQTAAIACPNVPVIVESGLDEIGYGRFDGGPLDAYLTWAWSSPPELDPDGGESRVAAVARVVAALGSLRRREEEIVLAVSHGAVVRWIVDAAAGVVPSARLEPVEFAVAHRLDASDVERAEETLGPWVADPRFGDAPNGS